MTGRPKQTTSPAEPVGKVHARVGRYAHANDFRNRVLGNRQRTRVPGLIIRGEVLRWFAPCSRVAIIMFTPTLIFPSRNGRATASRNSLFGTPRQ